MPGFLAEVLTWPGHSAYVTAIKAARSWSVPPTVMLVKDRQPDDGWQLIDRKLAMALQILEEETCPSCGTPIWLGHTTLSHVEFERKTSTCYACAERERERDEQGRDLTKLDPGESVYVVAKASEGMSLPTREEGYSKM